MLVPSAEKIAVVRANALGDLVFSLPALDALRAAYPAADLVLIGDVVHRELLTGRPSPVDRVIVAPFAQGVRDPRDGAEETASELEAFFSRMRDERFDIAIQLHGGGRFSNPFTSRLGARVTAGLVDGDAAPLDRVVPYAYYQSEWLRYLEVVALVGAAPVTLEPVLAVTDADLAEARAVIGEPSSLAVVHAGASTPRRRWPPERFAVVADELAAAGAQVVLTGVPAETAIVDEVAARMTAEPLVVTGRLSLGGLAGLLALADVVVSNDTGPLHLALAVGAATVGIFWCGNLMNGGPLSRTRHRPHISWRLHCPVCGLDSTSGRCEHEVSFVDVVPTDAVVRDALALLAGVERPAEAVR